MEETTQQLTITEQIGALLYAAAEPLSFKYLSTVLSVSEEEIYNALEDLRNGLLHTGLVLVVYNQTVGLATHPAASSDITTLQENDTAESLSSAALETFSIVLYSAPIAKREIDNIRGVNSNYILRSLTSRGLIEAVSDSEQSRTKAYQPTIEALMHLGIERCEDLPEYSDTHKKLASVVHNLDTSSSS